MDEEQKLRFQRNEGVLIGTIIVSILLFVIAFTRIANKEESKDAQQTIEALRAENAGNIAAANQKIGELGNSLQERVIDEDVVKEIRRVQRALLEHLNLDYARTESDEFKIIPRSKRYWER